jgi:hypothetical protein
MGIIDTILLNSEIILMVATVVLAAVARYFQVESSVLGAAGEALVELQQEFLSSIRDSVITKDELDTILLKVQAAEKALRDVLGVFTKPVPTTEKLSMIFGGGKVKAEVAKVNSLVYEMKVARMNK